MRRMLTAVLTGTVFLSFAAFAIFSAPGARADVEPGDTITAANWEKVKGLVPDEVIPFAVEGFEDLEMHIVPTGDYKPPQKYIEATVRYACQAQVDERGILRNYTAGQPFPYSDWATEATNHSCDLKEDDPQFALKLAWNVNYRWQGGSGLNLPHWGFSWMRNRGKEVWRIGQGEYRRTYFNHRADLLPDTSQLSEGSNVEWAEFFDVKTPFDLRGTMFLLYRYIDEKEDDTWAYIPALRRVRRVAATQKSDSLLGTDFSLEDFYMFAGYVWNQQWEYQGTSTMLAPYGGGEGNFGRKCWNNIIPGEETRLQGQTRLGSEDEWHHCEFGPYRALSFIGEHWQKREVIQLDDVPKQKGHPYSRKKLWYDKQTFMPVFSFMYDRAGQPYKIITGTWRWSEDSPIEDNHGKRVLNWSFISIANVQNGISHLGQFDNASAPAFAVAESRNYYDTTRLKRQGR